MAKQNLEAELYALTYSIAASRQETQDMLNCLMQMVISLQDELEGSNSQNVQSALSNIESARDHVQSMYDNLKLASYAAAGIDPHPDDGSGDYDNGQDDYGSN